MDHSKNPNPNNSSNHAPGKGSDKQHPETPDHANERFKKQNPENVQEKPGSQNTG